MEMKAIEVQLKSSNNRVAELESRVAKLTEDLEVSLTNLKMLIEEK